MDIVNEILSALSNIPNVYVAASCTIAGAIIRIIEKRKLRKKGVLNDQV